MDFIPHFNELRRRLLLCFAVFLAASIVSYFYSHAIFDFLTQPLRQTTHPAQLFFQKPYEAFLIRIKVAAFSGFLAAAPVILSQLWFFIAPGLYEKEKRVFIPVILISIVLFWAGVIFCDVFVIPWGLGFMLAFQTDTLKPMLAVGPYFSFLIGMMISFGVLFDFPVFLVGIVELGLVQTKTLAKSRRPIIVVIFIVAAILTPSPDPVSQILLAAPLLLLFEISLWIAARREKNAAIQSGARGRKD